MDGEIAPYQFEFEWKFILIWWNHLPTIEIPVNKRTIMDNQRKFADIGATADNIAPDAIA